MPKVNEREMKARVSEILNRWPTVGLAVGVVRDGRLEFFHGHGVADISTNTPITEDTVFRIASITKTFTAVAMMQLWEQGLVNLDAPANDYLRAYQLIPATPGSRPATLRHLLTHTAGIPQMPRPSRALTTVFTGSWLTEGGESFDFGHPLPTLAEFYHGRLRLVAEPGTRFTYGDHGFATLGQIVEDVSGESLGRYLREHIFEPLGMSNTDLRRSELVTSRLATGYSLHSNGPKAVTDRDWVTAGASSIYSTPRDMARYVAALLGGGANEHGSMLKPATTATMFEPHYQTDPRLPSFGLGFFRDNLGGHLAVEHAGILPGFNSEMWLAPDDGVGVVAFTNGASRALMWMPREISGLLKQLLRVPDEVVRTDVPHRPELWGDICGWYPLSAQLTDMQARSIAGLGVEVFVRRGQLMIRALGPSFPGKLVLHRGFPLHPDDDNDPYIFRVDLSEFGIGTARYVFSRDGGGAVTRVHFELIPLSLQKQPAIKNPQLWVTGVGGALALATTATAVRRRRATLRHHRVA